jgi:hypothetical protein
LKKLFLIILFVMVPISAWSATYYVKNGGNDNATGIAPETAWATIARVKATTGYDNIVTDGDTVYFDRQGSWSGTAVVLSTTTGVVYDGTTFNTGGTQARAKLIATAAGGARDAVVSMNGTSATTTVLKGFEIDCNDIGVTGLGVGFNSSSASNILIDNCVIHNTLNAGWYYGMVVSYADSDVSNVTVQNCEGYDTAQEIFCVYNSTDGSASNILFRNNIVHNGGTSTTVGGYNVGFEIKNNTNGVTMEYNKIYNCETGIHIHADGNTPVNTVIRYNLIYNCDGTGINWQNTLGGNMTTSVYGNLLYGNATSGVYYNQDLRLPGNSNINIYNNTIYNTSSLADGAVRIAAGGGTVNFRNNIVYTTNSPGVYDSGGYLTHSDNLIYRASGTAITDNSTNYTSAEIADWDNTAIGTDPAFSGGTLPTGFSGTYGSNMVPNTDYFQLTVDSPAKDTGYTIEGYTGCINGAGLATPIVRPLGAAFDIGAYEYGTVAQSGGSAGQGFFLQGVTIR